MIRDLPFFRSGVFTMVEERRVVNEEFGLLREVMGSASVTDETSSSQAQAALLQPW